MWQMWLSEARPQWSNLVEAHVKVKRVKLAHVLKLLALRRGPWGAAFFLVYLWNCFVHVTFKQWHINIGNVWEIWICAKLANFCQSAGVLRSFVSSFNSRTVFGLTGELGEIAPSLVVAEIRALEAGDLGRSVRAKRSSHSHRSSIKDDERELQKCSTWWLVFKVLLQITADSAQPLTIASAFSSSFWNFYRFEPRNVTNIAMGNLHGTKVFTEVFAFTNTSTLLTAIGSV